jgi:hypothetical protein
MTPKEARELAAEWGAAGRECLARRTQAGSPEGKAYARWLESLPPAAAADEIRAAFAFSQSTNLAVEIATDLGLDPQKAAAIAAPLVATRQRIAHVTRPFRRRGGPADNEAA